MQAKGLGGSQGPLVLVLALPLMCRCDLEQVADPAGPHQPICEMRGSLPWSLRALNSYKRESSFS